MNLEGFNGLFNSGLGAAIVAALGWVLKDVYSRYMKNRETKKKADYMEGLRAIANVYNAMDILKDRDEITRVCLLEISNGGNKPKPGSKMWASAINVKHDDVEKGHEILGRYDKVRIDHDYITMCIEVQESQKPYKINVKEYNKNSILSNFYKLEGVTYSEVYHIYTDGKDEKMFILSVATENEGERFDKDNVRATIASELSIIRSSFERYRNTN